MFALAMFARLTAHSQDSLNVYLRLAAENSPGVRAAFHAYEAALQKSPQAGALQDPSLEMGFFLQPMELVEGRQIADFQLMQMFPWFGTRKAARTEAQQMAQMAFEQFREVRDQLFLDIYTQWFTLCRLQRQLVVSRENRLLLAQLCELALQRFSAADISGGSARRSTAAGVVNAKNAADNSGGGAAMSDMNMTPDNTPQSSASGAKRAPSMSGAMAGMSGASSGMMEVLRIQSELAELDSNIESLLSETVAEKARFNLLLNRRADSELQVPDTLRQIPFLFDMEAARDGLDDRNPALAMLDAEDRMYRAKADMNRKMSYPMFGVGLEYMLIARSTNAASGDDMNAMSGGGMSSMNGRDMLMPMISITLPVWRGKYRAQQRETALLQQSVRERRQNVQNLLEAELYSAKHRLDDAARRIDLYRRQSELIHTTYMLTVSGFASGKNDLSGVIQVRRQLLDYELKTSDAVADYNTAVATLQKLMSGYDGGE
jgi:outer membrane protein TolC